MDFQRNEITEYHIYKRRAKTIKSPEISQVLDKIVGDELVSRLFGVIFGIKLMERGEEGAQSKYAQLRGPVKEIYDFIQGEHSHEEALIGLLDAESLRYAGSVEIPVAKDAPFRRRFLEMAGLSLGMASQSFVQGFFIRSALGVEL